MDMDLFAGASQQEIDSDQLGLMHSLVYFISVYAHFALPQLTPFHQQPFEALFDFVQQINQVLEKLITWPRLCGQATGICQRTFPNPLSDVT